MNVYILYQNFLSRDGKVITVGGIQTYITNLSKLFIEEGCNVFVFQQAEKDFEKIYGDIHVVGCGYHGHQKGLYKYLYSKVKKLLRKDDVLIYGDDSFIVKNDVCKTISLQHGVFWDKPQRIGCSKLVFLLDYVMKSYRALKLVNRIKKVDKLICVDYNFVNWYRAIVSYPQAKIAVIPNFSRLIDLKADKFNEKNINIIFARRFFDYRGTRVFVSAITRILDEYNNIKVTVAGEGPDEKFLYNSLKKYEKVEFIKYNSEDTLSIHENKHIALVPTLGSEGTSLSLLEAMATQCAVICTNVGGMTNIVLDGYNGKIIDPGDSNQLYIAIKDLLDNSAYRKKIAMKGYETVQNAFSYECWREKWKKEITDMM